MLGYLNVIVGIVELKEPHGEHRVDKSVSFAMQTVTQEKQFNSICLVEVAVEWAVNASRSRKNNKSGSRVESETRSGSLVPRRRTVAANCVTSSNVLHNVVISRNYSHNATKNKNRRGQRKKKPGGHPLTTGFPSINAILELLPLSYFLPTIKETSRCCNVYHPHPPNSNHPQQ